MDEGDVRFMSQAMCLFAEAMAIEANIKGMEAENKWREHCGNSIAYAYDSFAIKEVELQEIAMKLRNL